MPTPSAHATLVAWLSPRRRAILLLMLGLLQLALLESSGSAMERVLMVMHIALFFLWQPFVRTEQRLSARHLVMVGIMVLVTSLLQSTATIMLWVMILGGIIGGKIFVADSRWTRVFHLAALTYLVLVLLIVLLPRLLPAAIREPLDALVRYGLPLILVFMLFLPGERRVAQRPEMVDFAYSVFIFMLLAVLVLGSLAGMLLTGLGYVETLLLVLLAIATVLLFIGWSWNPHGGFAGVGTVVSRYLLSSGLPLELWVESLAAYPAGQSDPQEFLAWACDKLRTEVSWVNGVAWSAKAAQGSAGHCAGRCTPFGDGDVRFEVYSPQTLTPTVIWQMNMLLQLLREFYLARMRERQLRDLGYLQAIYETGARLTHDVKNILQSLNTLCAAAASEATPASVEFQDLVRRQLPVIAQRLRHTLDKLRQPGDSTLMAGDAAGWWQQLQDSFAGRRVAFSASQPQPVPTLPTGLFASAAENLLENALAKRHLQDSITISVELGHTAGGAQLRVRDSGTAVPPALAARLGQAPVRSDNGLGIGLYQVARLARECGYALTLEDNRDGNVCFMLAPAPASAQA